MDDFAPRHEYPESMRKLEEYCKKVKDSGMKYGEYVKANPDAPSVPRHTGDTQTRICKQCGKEFEVAWQEERQKYERWKSCEKCRGAQGEYHLTCQICGAPMTAKTKARKYCSECSRVLNCVRVARRREERLREQSLGNEV